MTFATYEESHAAGAPVFLYRFTGSAGTIGPYCFTNAEEAITRDGLTYAPWPVKHGEIVSSGSMDKKTLDVNLARGTELDSLFSAFPPSQIINLFIYKGHYGDAPTPENFPAEWSGQVRGANYEPSNELVLTLEPISTSMKMPGLRRNYQLGCPLALYGTGDGQCNANRAASTYPRTVASITGNGIGLTGLAISATAFLGGTVSWTRTGGIIEVRTVTYVSVDGLTVFVRGDTRGLTVGGAIDLTAGCNHTMADCKTIHNNIRNFGGQPNIPLKNMFASASIFY